MTPAYTVTKQLDRGELVRLDVADFSIQMHSIFLCSKERWINPVMQAFIQTALDMKSKVI